jgi:hypothetical protein
VPITRNRVLFRDPTSKQFFAKVSAPLAVFLRYGGDGLTLFRFLPFYLWARDTAYTRGPIWSLRDNRLFLFFYFFNLAFSVQPKFFSSKFLFLKKANVGEIGTVVLNQLFYYTFFFSETIFPEQRSFKLLARHFFKKNWLYFVPSPNMLPLARLSSTLYTFQYASHKSIITPLRAYS